MDFDTYLLPPGKADVLFPTSFAQLEQMYTQIAMTKGATTVERCLRCCSTALLPVHSMQQRKLPASSSCIQDHWRTRSMTAA